MCDNFSCNCRDFQMQPITTGHWLRQGVSHSIVPAPAALRLVETEMSLRPTKYSTAICAASPEDMTHTPRRIRYAAILVCLPQHVQFSASGLANDTAHIITCPKAIAQRSEFFIRKDGFKLIFARRSDAHYRVLGRWFKIWRNLPGVMMWAMTGNMSTTISERGFISWALS